MKAIIISGPNTVGKGTILDRVILKSNAQVSKVIRYTSRPIGQNEIAGETYHFVSDSEFNIFIDKRELAEYTRFGHGYYGTKLKDVFRIIERGVIPVIDLDVPSAKTLYIRLESIGVSTRRYFVSPVSKDVLIAEGGIDTALSEIRKRIISRNRGFDVAEEVIQHRLSVAKEQLIEHIEYPHFLGNSNGKEDEATDLVIDDINSWTYFNSEITNFNY